MTLEQHTNQSIQMQALEQALDDMMPMVPVRHEERSKERENEKGLEKELCVLQELIATCLCSKNPQYVKTVDETDDDRWWGDASA